MRESHSISMSVERKPGEPESDRNRRVRSSHVGVHGLSKVMGVHGLSKVMPRFSGSVRVSSRWPITRILFYFGTTIFTVE